jgi:hypothetical protein
MTSKTISTSIQGYSFAASGTNLTITSTGRITGSGGTGSSAIYGGASRAGETILNLGTVSDAAYLYGIVLQDGATITNGSATDTVASISASQVGIKISGLAGAITNFGSIHAAQKGIVLSAGGAVTNGSAADTTALISGQYAVGIDGAVGRVTNFGTIQGQVNLYSGGVVTNEASGTIIDRDAVYIAGGAGTVTNLGTITGVVRDATGQVVNGSATDHSASITGGSGQYGVYLGTGTLTNFGTISGPKEAVSLGTGGVLIAEAGSKLVGPASYGDGVTLEFGAGGGAGTILGLGTGSISGSTTDKFKNLQAYEVQAGASWTLSGTNTLKNGDSLAVLGTLSVAGTLSVGGSLQGAGKLSIASGTTTLLAGSQLTIANLAQSGSSNIVVNEALAYAGALLQSSGTISVGASRVLTLKGADSFKGTLAGAGTLALTGGSTAFGAGAVVSIAKVTQSGTSVVAIGGGALSYAGVWTQSKGTTINVGAGQSLSFTGTGDSFSGALGGGGTVAFKAGSDTLNAATLSAVSIVINGAAVTLSGAITLTKALSVTSPVLKIAAAGASLTGGGTLTLTNLATNKIVGVTAAATLTNVKDRIVGGGDIGGGSMKLVNQVGASIVGNSATVALTLDTGTSAISNTGLIASEGKGGVTIKSAVANNGTLEVTAGTLTVGGAVTGTGKTTIAGGKADFASTFSQNVAFTGTTGVLELAKSQTYAATISGFSLTGGTSLDLVDIAFTSGKTKATFVENVAKTSGVLTVTDGTHTAHLTLAGNFSASTFRVSSDGHGGTTIVDPTAPSAPHFVAAMAAMAAPAGGSMPPARWAPPAAALLAHARD